MRKFIPLRGFVAVLFILLILGSSDVLLAKRTGLELVKKRSSLRTLIRTRLVIIHAQKTAKMGQKYAGLGNCLRHQRIARRLHFRQRYLFSAFHSLRARKIAVLIIMNNKGTLIKEANFTKEEKRILKSSPADEALDKELDEKYKNEAPPIDDKSAADKKIGEIKEKKE